MTEPHDPQQPGGSGPLFGGLPRYAGSDNEPPAPTIPSRSQTWGRTGAIVCGGVGVLFGLFLLISSLGTGNPDLQTAVVCLIVMPLAFGLSGWMGWTLRGLLWDRIMASKDDEKRRELERKQAENAEWAGVDAIMRRKREER